MAGEIHPLNIVTVHAPGQLVGVCGLAFGIGLISDLLKHSDERRWMKKARYACKVNKFPLMLQIGFQSFAVT